MLPWIFFIVMHLPSFGGPILARVQTVDEVSCHKFRKLVMQQIRDQRLNYEVTECSLKGKGEL